MNTSNLPGELLIGLGAVAVVVWVAALTLPPPRRRPAQRACLWTVGGVVGAYLAGRAVAEFFLVNYGRRVKRRGYAPGTWGRLARAASIRSCGRSKSVISPDRYRS